MSPATRLPPSRVFVQQVLKKVQDAAQETQADIRNAAQGDRERMEAEAAGLLSGLRENHETGNELVRKLQTNPSAAVTWNSPNQRRQHPPVGMP